MSGRREGKSRSGGRAGDAKGREGTVAIDASFVRQILDINPHLIFAKDREGRFTLVNRALAEIYGTTVEELTGKRDSDFNADSSEVENFRRDDLAVMDGLQEKFIAEELITDASGRRRWLQTIKRPIVGPNGKADQVLGVATDITRHKEAEDGIQRLVHADPLTGLANRILLDARVRQDLSRAHRAREPLALIFLDVDRFKNVNDTLGHRIGDELLIQVAARLDSIVRDEDTLCRLGGDEFVLVLPNTDADGAANVAEKLLKITAPSYRLEQHVLTCTVSAHRAT